MQGQARRRRARPDGGGPDPTTAGQTLFRRTVPTPRRGRRRAGSGRPGRLRGAVDRVEEAAGAEREAAAADAGGEVVADALEQRDALLDVVPPGAREALPVALRRRLAGGQQRQRGADRGQRDARRSARLDDGDAAQDGALVAALVAVASLRVDQPLGLVEAQGRGRDAAALRDLSDRQHRRGHRVAFLQVHFRLIA